VEEELDEHWPAIYNPQMEEIRERMLEQGTHLLLTGRRRIGKTHDMKLVPMELMKIHILIQI